jgi:hypothetical protein
MTKNIGKSQRLLNSFLFFLKVQKICFTHNVFHSTLNINGDSSLTGKILPHILPPQKNNFL